MARKKYWSDEEALEIWAKGIKTFPPPKEGKKYGPSDAFKPLFINNYKNRLKYSTEATPKYYRTHAHRFSGDLLYGGGGGGKTATSNALCLEYMFKYPGTRGLIGAKTLKDVKSIVMDAKWGIKDLLSIKEPWDHPAVISYPNDLKPVLVIQPFKDAPKHMWSEMELFHFDDWERVRGKNIDWARFEELSQVNIPDIIDELPRRMRSENMPCSHFFGNTNPPETMTHWSTNKWNIDQHMEGYEDEPGFIGKPCTCQFCQVCLDEELGEYTFDDDGFCTNKKCPEIKLSTLGLPAKRDEYVIDGVKTFCPGNQYYWRVLFSSAKDNQHIRSDFLQTLKGSSDSRVYQIYALGKPMEMNANNVFGSFSFSNIRSENKDIDYGKDIMWSFDFNNRPQCSVICQETYKSNGQLDYIDQIDEIILFDIKEIVEKVNSQGERERGASPEHVAEEFMRRYPDFKNTIYMYGDPTAVNKTSGPLEATKYQIIFNILTVAGYKVEMMVKKTKGEKRIIPIIDRVNNANFLFRNNQAEIKVYINEKCRYTTKSIKDLKWSKDGETVDKRLIDEYARRTTEVILPDQVYKKVVFVSHPADALTYYLFQKFPIIKGTDKVMFFQVPGEHTTIFKDGQIIENDVRKESFTQPTVVDIIKQDNAEEQMQTLADYLRSNVEQDELMSAFMEYFQ